MSRGKCKSWTVDSEQDCGLKFGLIRSSFPTIKGVYMYNARPLTCIDMTHVENVRSLTVSKPSSSETEVERRRKLLIFLLSQILYHLLSLPLISPFIILIHVCWVSGSVSIADTTKMHRELHFYFSMEHCSSYLASSPGSTQLFNITRECVTLKSWVEPGDKASSYPLYPGSHQRAWVWG